MVENVPAMQETQVQSLGQKDPLEKGMAVLLPGKSHGQSMGSQRVRHDLATNTHNTFHT